MANGFIMGRRITPGGGGIKTVVLFEGNHLGNITTPIVSNVQLPVTHSMGTIYSSGRQ